MELKVNALGLQMHPMSQTCQECAEMAPHFERRHAMLLGQPAAQQTEQMFCRIGRMTKATAAAPAAKMAAHAPRPPVRRALPRAPCNRAATEKLILGAVDDGSAREASRPSGLSR